VIRPGTAKSDNWTSDCFTDICTPLIESGSPGDRNLALYPTKCNACPGVLAPALPIRLLVAYSSDLYRFLWQYASLVELERLLFAGAARGALTFLAGAVFIHGTGLAPNGMPYSTLINDAVFAYGLLAAPGLGYRLLHRAPHHRARANKRVLIAGAGAVGQAILRETRVGQLNLRPVGFVDEDASKRWLRESWAPECMVSHRTDQDGSRKTGSRKRHGLWLPTP